MPRRSRRSDLAYGTGPTPLSRKLHVEVLEDRRMLAVISVNTLVDEDDGPGVGAGTSLRDAIAVAAPGDTIDFLSSATGLLILDPALGELIVANDLTIDGTGGVAIVGQGSGRIFNIGEASGTSPLVNLSTLAITGGFADNGGAIINAGSLTLFDTSFQNNEAAFNGGAIWSSGTLEIFGGQMTDNLSGGDGGAIYSVGSLTLDGVTLTNNATLDGLDSSSQFNNGESTGNGGAVWSSGYTTILNNSTITGNTTGDGGAGYDYYSSFSTSSTGGKSGDGGGLWLSGTTTISDSVISGNSTGDGGNGYNADGMDYVSYGGDSGNGGGVFISGDATITNSTISGNFTSNGGNGITSYSPPNPPYTNYGYLFGLGGFAGNGGGVFADGNLTITGNSQITGNVTGLDGGIDGSPGYGGGNGGGVANADFGYHSLLIESSTINDNSSNGAGGGLIGIGDITITGATISNNQARFSGGGVSFDRNATVAAVSNTTISGNSASSGGGLSSGGTTTITTSQVTSNTARFDGGGIRSFTPITISTTTVAENTADRLGGGIYLDAGESEASLLEELTVTMNTASEGGGIYGRLSGGAIDLTRSQITSNTAHLIGGGVRPFFSEFSTTTGTFNITDTSIASNTAGFTERTGEIARWRANGDATDDVGPHNGTLNGGVVFDTGKTEQAFVFDGVDDFVEVPDADVFTDAMTDDFTIELWARLDSLGGGTLGNPEHVFIGHSEGGGEVDKWLFGVGGGKLFFHMNDPFNTGRFLFQYPYSPEIGSWHHLAVAKQGHVSKLYVDGIEVAVSGIASGFPSVDAPLTIGSGEGFFMEGRLDEVTIHDDDLTAEQIAAIYQDDARSVSGLGGGVAAQLAGDGVLTIEHSTLNDNDASKDGGGLYVEHVSGGQFTTLNSTISGNDADRHGGGIFVVGEPTNPDTLRHSTITQNHADDNSNDVGSGGGIYLSTDAEVQLDHTIVAGNFNGVAEDLFTDPTATLTAAFSLIGDSTGSGLTPTVDATMLDASGNLIGPIGGKPIDLHLGPLFDNAGTTLTHALLPDSPAIDAGDITAAATTDQRGAPWVRNDGNGVDIGAYERQITPIPLIVDTTVDENDEDFSAGDLSLREAIFLANASAGADTITFSPQLQSQTILLSEGELVITDSLTIDASTLPENLTIDAQQQSRVVNYDASSGDLTFVGLNLTGSTFVFDGGGVRFASDGDLTLIETRVIGNRSSYGGGIYTLHGNVSLASSTVSNNTAGNEGGGIWAQNGDIFLNGSSVNNNSLQQSLTAKGGGIYSLSGVVRIEQSTISGNFNDAFDEDYGAGIYLSSGQLILDASTISGNESRGGYGGGVFSRFASVTLVESTVINNTANYEGGGIHVFNSSSDPAISIRNSIIAGNSDNGTGRDLFPDPESSLTINHSLIGVADNLGTINGNVGNLTGTAASPLDPLLGPLADYGGPTLTHRLLPGSPAIDAGDPAILFDPAEFDQRGAPFSRVAGGRIDIGAYESQDITPPFSLVVDTLIDENDGDYSEGDLSLREAIGLANGSLGADVINFDNGLSGGVIDLTLGQFEITDELTIDASALDKNLKINAKQQSRLFNISSETGDFNFAGLHLYGGKTTANKIEGRGGAIRSRSSGHLSISRTTVSNNMTTGLGAHGGGISAIGEVTIAQSIVEDNITTGTIAIGGGLLTFDTATIIDSIVSGNNTIGDSSDGGGVYAQDGIVITGSVIQGNSTSGDTAEGGGVDTHGNLVLSQSTLSGNSTSGTRSYGGGIYAAGNVSISQSTILANVTSGDSAYGGGLSIGGNLTLDGSTVSNNRTLGETAGGGGISVVHDSTITLSTISENSTLGIDAYGGGIISGGVLLIDQSTVAGNSASSNLSRAGGIWNTGSPIGISNSIIATNVSGGADPDLRSGSGTLTINHSLIGVADNLGTINGNVGNLTGTAASPLDPFLGPLADYGGPTLTHRLLPGSPAIDAGDPSITFDPSEFDQRGAPFTRVVGGRIDIGAYESSAAIGPLSQTVADALGLLPSEVEDLDTGLLLWLDGNDASTFVGGETTLWLDKSVTNSTAFQFDANAAPVRSGPWIDFTPDTDGSGSDSDDSLSLTLSNAPAGQWTGTVVFEVDGNSTDQGIVNPTPFTAAGFSITHHFNLVYSYYGNGSNHLNTTADVGQPHGAISAWTGGTNPEDRLFWANGEQVFTGQGSPVDENQLSTQLTLGDAATPLDGRIGTVIIHSGVLSDTARQQLEGYLNAVWGTPLPPGHPFAAVVENADFNSDTTVDGFDFLTWQRGSGTTSGATLDQGDANGDGAIGVADLAIWETQYGNTTTPAVSSLLAQGDSAIKAERLDSVAAKASSGSKLSLPAELIDAAIALQWSGRNEGTASSDSLTEELVVLEDHFIVPVRVSPSSFDLSAGNETLRSPEAEESESSGEEAWLAEELLEFVFS